jgi:hypothetical protein
MYQVTKNRWMQEFAIYIVSFTQARRNKANLKSSLIEEWKENK